MSLAMKERYEFKPNTAYKLIGVTDHFGRNKATYDGMYLKYTNCIAVEFEYDDERLYIKFLEDLPRLHTSSVYKVEETEDGLKIWTRRSIYVLEEIKRGYMSWNEEDEARYQRFMEEQQRGSRDE